MAEISIYHNPRCSKSRSALSLLQEKGADCEVIEYLKTPPSAKALGSICQKLGVAPTAIIRSKEALFKELGLSLKDDRSAAAWLEILAEHPQLIERPIVVKGKRAVMGRPPENVLELL